MQSFARRSALGTPRRPGAIQPAAHLDCDTAEDIRARIDALEVDGTLNHGQATALRAKLDQAERHEAAGRPEEAEEAYARLIAQVEEWVADGVLTEEEAAELLVCAEDVLDGPDVSFTVVSASADNTCGVTTGGDAYCWGRNTPLASWATETPAPTATPPRRGSTVRPASAPHRTIVPRTLPWWSPKW